MSNKVTIGLFALLFIATSIQSFAISKMAGDHIEKSQSGVASLGSYKLNKNQQAYVAGSITDKTPEPEEYILYVDSNGLIKCSYIQDGDVYADGIPSGVGDIGNENSSAGCNGARNNYLSANTRDLSVKNPSYKTLLITGDPVFAMQFKLLLAGYLEVENLTGKIDKVSNSAISSFQKEFGLPVSGSFDIKTQNFLDSRVSFINSILKNYQNESLGSQLENSLSNSIITVDESDDPQELLWLCREWVGGYGAGNPDAIPVGEPGHWRYFPCRISFSVAR